MADAFPSYAEAASLAQVIRGEGGKVTFARFMELALTHPTLGYYAAAEGLLGPSGDFSTAPTLCAFFNRTVARLVTELVEDFLTAKVETQGKGWGAPPAAAPPTASSAAPLSVVELGGGEGHLARGVLEFWQQAHPEWRNRVTYQIVEVSAGLQQIQASALREFSEAGWQVAWGRDLREACAGTQPAVVVANEFFDALPVHILRVVDGAIEEAYVKAGPGTQSLRQVWGPPVPAAEAELAFLFGLLDPRALETFTEDRFIEVSPARGALLGDIAALMPMGSIVNIDYGDWFATAAGKSSGGATRGDAAAPAAPAAAKVGSDLGGQPLLGRKRRQTVRGYFRHQVADDPLARPGKQDLTADVDFAALDLHGRRAGFEAVVYTTLAALLRAGGAQAELGSLYDGGAGVVPYDLLEVDRQATILASLAQEEDVGGAFKVMVQVKE